MATTKLTSVKITLAVGLVLAAAALGVTLSRSPLTVAATNSVAANPHVALAPPNSRACQAGATIPRGTSAIRISLGANAGPKVTVTVMSGSRLVTKGQRAAGWGLEETVTVPVARVRHTVANVRVCVNLGPALEQVVVGGTRTHVAAAHGRGYELVTFRIEYLRPGRTSWWSRASSVAHRMGLGRAASGRSIAFVVLALMIVIAVLALRLALRDLANDRGDTAPRGHAPRSLWHRAGERLQPRAAWICALIACLNAACWSIVTPPFQVPDEPSHFAYVSLLAETGRLPASGGPTVFSADEQTILLDLHQQQVMWHPETHTISTATQQRKLQAGLGQPLSRVGEGAGVAASEPPLYYLLETIPYGLASAGTLLDQLELMRLLGAIMAGLTALFVFLFLREALPARRWSWTVGALAVSLAPLLAFMSGAVDPDSMLFAVSAALFYCLARSFRRGLTRRLAIAIGVVAAIGLLTKLNFAGLLPGTLLGLTVVSARQARATGRSAYLSLLVACAIAASPGVVYATVNILSGHPLLGIVSGALASKHPSLRELSYIWQYYLPRLPGMTNDFPGLSSTYQLWFKRSVGLYGWLDTSFPTWVYTFALLPAIAIVALCTRALIDARIALSERLAELLAYAVMAAGLMALIGASSYTEFPTTNSAYAEPRYLLPLLCLTAATLALAARGAGRRWGPAVGMAIVVLFLAYDIASQLIVVSRFYG